MRPLFTVLMPVYNAEKYLSSSINSILAQTLPDFELLIIDDGSTDNSESIIRSFDDRRIRFLKNEKNLKLIRTLNRGMDEATGRYLARMDADDISFPQRLERQAEFFSTNPETDVLGSYAIKINENGTNGALIKKPTGDNINSTIWLPTPLLHPTVVMNMNRVGKFRYDESALHCEDYDLWIRLARLGFIIDNYPAPLIYYRVHSGGVSSQNREIQLLNSFSVFKKYYSLEINFNDYCGLIGVLPNISIIKRLSLVKLIAKDHKLNLWNLAFHTNLHFKSIVFRG